MAYLQFDAVVRSEDKGAMLHYPEWEEKQETNLCKCQQQIKIDREKINRGNNKEKEEDGVCGKEEGTPNA